MKSRPSIKRNFIFSLINQFAGIAIPLIVTPYTSRVFGADGIGINSYTTANVTYFMLFCMLGIAGYGQRTIAIIRDDKEEVSKVFWELQGIHFATFLLCSAVYLFVIFKSVNYRVYYIAQYTLLISSFFDISWFYQAYERFDFITIRNLVLRVALLVSVFSFIHTKKDLALYIFLNGFATLASNISLWFGIKKQIVKVNFRELNFSRHMKDIMIFFLPTIAASVYSILDKSVINWVTHDDSQNGFYEQAYKMLQICNILVQTLSTVSSPRMANVYSNGNKEEFKNRLNSSLEFMLLISMPVAFGVASIAKTFVPIFFGEVFDAVVNLLYVFMPLVIVLGFSVYLDGMYLVPSGKRLQSALAVVAGSVTNLFLNLVLVKYHGAFGAAIATLLTELLVTSIMISLSRDVLEWKTIWNAMAKYLFGAVLMSAIVVSIASIQMNEFASLIIQVCSGIFAYFLFLFVIKDKQFNKYIAICVNFIGRGRKGHGK